MNTKMISHRTSGVWSLFAAALCLFPSLASAHPGHYHPGEEDEFGALRANFAHLHGSLEIGVACLALAALVVFIVNRNRPLRVASALVVVGALAFFGTP
jgi:hypothetical protein